MLKNVGLHQVPASTVLASMLGVTAQYVALVSF